MKAHQCLDEASIQMFVEGTLQDAATPHIKEHLAGCPHCRRAISDYKQLMWDLDHPTSHPLPDELSAVYDRVMSEWDKEIADQRQAMRRTRSIVPAWAGYTWSWTRQVPGVSRVGWLLSRTGGTVAKTILPKWLRFGGGGRR